MRIRFRVAFSADLSLLRSAAVLYGGLQCIRRQTGQRLFARRCASAVPVCAFFNNRQIIFKKLLTNAPRSAIIVNVESQTKSAGMAQLVEHILGKDEVISSTLITSSRKGKS